MNSRSPSDKSSPREPFLTVVASIAALGILAPSPAPATGNWNSINLLVDHQFAAIASPEFWLELELKELARNYAVREKFVPSLATADADLASFEAAVEAGKVNAADIEGLRAQLKAARAAILELQPDAGDEAGDDPDGAEKPVKEIKAIRNADQPLPTEEFALYQRGAEAYHAAHYEQAQAAWKALLALPEANRRYRSVWASYMLGRSEIAAMGDGRPMAVARSYFQKTRELAAQGFHDPQGLAAASYGWEAYTWKGRNPQPGSREKAIELYLRQLATGDNGAFASIKSVIRQRYFSEHDDDPDPANPQAQAGPSPEDWAAAANSSLLRQVITRWHLAMGADVHYAYYDDGEAGRDNHPAAKWLALLEQAGPEAKAEEADRLGWLAYRNGAYDQAQRWLKLVAAESRLSLWLTAKLALRAGDIAKADAALATAQALFTAPERLELSGNEMRVPLPKAAATADRAVVLLGEAKFPEALTEFLNAGCWQDAAYVAERVLTLQELQAYVAKNYPHPAKQEESSVSRDVLARVVRIPAGEQRPDEADARSEDDPTRGRFDWGPRSILEGAVAHEGMDPRDPKYRDAVAWRLRWLLGRRMVREDQEAASRPFLPRDVQPVLDAYINALASAKNKNLSKTQQAKGWWTAAWIARHAGLELTGTELYPDGAWDGGIFESADVHAVRRAGAEFDFDLPENENADATTPRKLTKKIKFGVAPSAEEKRRLEKNALPWEYRFQYRWLAAALAKKAAALLKDGTEEKADVLNHAGSWMFSRDVKAEEWFFFAIKRTCPNTKIGKAVLKTKHTTPMPGPWSGTPDAEGN